MNTIQELKLKIKKINNILLKIKNANVLSESDQKDLICLKLNEIKNDLEDELMLEELFLRSGEQK